MLRPHVNAYDVSQFPRPRVWHYFAFCGLLIVRQFATTCVTLQNSHRSELLWHYFCTRFGHTDARITDISSDKVGHRGLLIMWSQSLRLSSQPKALLLYFDKWEILDVSFLHRPIWNCHIHIQNHTIGPPDQLVWNDTLRPIIQLRLIESFGFWRNNSKVFPDEI